MSIYLPGVTFPGKRVTPSDDGAVFAACVSDGLYGGTITTSGTSLLLSPGKIVACGRAIRIASQTDIAMTETSGYARLVLTIDKSKSAAQQVALDVEYQGSETFPALTQNDINGSGTKYQVALCMARLSSSATTILWTCGSAHGKGKGITVQLPAGAANWLNNQHTAYVSGVTANSIVDLMPSLEVQSRLFGDGVTAMYIDNTNGVLTATVIGGQPSTSLSIPVLITELSTEPAGS